MQLILNLHYKPLISSIPLKKIFLFNFAIICSNINVNLDSLTDCMDKIDDTLLAFGAMILSANGKDEYAYNILNSKIDKDKIDLKQRIFLDVLTRNKTHHPELYRLLQKNRKNGFDKEDILLVNEFNLALKLADMSNALEIITILYKPFFRLNIVIYQCIMITIKAVFGNLQLH